MGGGCRAAMLTGPRPLATEQRLNTAVPPVNPWKICAEWWGASYLSWFVHLGLVATRSFPPPAPLRATCLPAAGPHRQPHEGAPCPRCRSCHVVRRKNKDEEKALASFFTFSSYSVYHTHMAMWICVTLPQGWRLLGDISLNPTGVCLVEIGAFPVL